MVWHNVRFSGMVSLRMEYPSFFLLEVYGMFGQTIAYVKKENGSFLLIAGDQKSTDQSAFEELYGLKIEDFMDDLAMNGPRQQVDGKTVIERPRYRVVYDQDRRARRKITWQGPDGKMELLFTQVSFAPGEADVNSSGRKM